MPIGSTTNVWVYSNTDSVELFLNGVSLGKKNNIKYSHLSWDNVTVEAGYIQSVGYNNNIKVIEEFRNTTGTPATIVITERIIGKSGMKADSADVAMFEISIIDTNQNVFPTANNEITFSVSGPGKIYGVGNGDPSDHGHDKASIRKG